MNGWYRMHRGWMDHPVFRGDEFSRRDAFQWLIQEACFKPTDVRVASTIITLQRGQLAHSLRYLAKAWGWSEPRVRRFLKATQEAKIIDASADAGQTVITICNYEKYQVSPRAADADRDAVATQARCVGDAKKKEGKEREEEGGRVRARDGGDYAFAGRTIRLNAADFERWRTTFSAIPDLAAELLAIDGWFQAQPDADRRNWFHRVPQMLNRKHQDALAEVRKATVDPAAERRAQTYAAADDFIARKLAWEKRQAEGEQIH